MTEHTDVLTMEKTVDINQNLSVNNDVETKLLMIISKLLPKRSRAFNRNDNIFDCGADSLTVIEFVYQAQSQGIKIGANQISQYPTIASLAKIASNELESGSCKTTSAASDTKLIPLLPNQLAYGFTKSMTVCTYLLKPAFKLDKNNLELALQFLIKRHEALRIRFVENNSQWEQIVEPSMPSLILEYIKFGLFSNDELLKQEIESHCNRLIKSIDIEKKSVSIRAALFEWDNEQRFFLAIDHYSFDELSMKLFWNELYSAYQGKALPSVAVSYGKIIEKLYDMANSWDYVQDQDFWFTQLRQVKHIPKTVTDTTKVSEGIKAKNLCLHTDKWVCTLIKEIPSMTGIQVHEVLFTAWIQTILEWSHLQGVVMILGTHNRGLLDEMAHTMGCFVTCYPVYLEIKETDHPKQAVDAIRAQLQQIPHKGMRYMISMMTQPTWKEAVFSIPQPSLGFNYLGEEEIKKDMWQDSKDEIKGKLVSVSKGELLLGRHQTGGIPYLILHAQINSISNSIILTCDYDSGHYDEQAIEHLLVQYKEKLHAYTNYLGKNV